MFTHVHLMGVRANLCRLSKRLDCCLAIQIKKKYTIYKTCKKFFIIFSKTLLFEHKKNMNNKKKPINIQKFFIINFQKSVQTFIRLLLNLFFTV